MAKLMKSNLSSSLWGGSKNSLNLKANKFNYSDFENASSKFWTPSDEFNINSLSVTSYKPVSCAATLDTSFNMCDFSQIECASSKSNNIVLCSENTIDILNFPYMKVKIFDFQNYLNNTSINVDKPVFTLPLVSDDSISLTVSPLYFVSDFIATSTKFVAQALIEFPINVLNGANSDHVNKLLETLTKTLDSVIPAVSAFKHRVISFITDVVTTLVSLLLLDTDRDKYIVAGGFVARALIKGATTTIGDLIRASKELCRKVSGLMSEQADDGSSEDSLPSVFKVVSDILVSMFCKMFTIPYALVKDLCTLKSFTTLRILWSGVDSAGKLWNWITSMSNRLLETIYFHFTGEHTPWYDAILQEDVPAWITDAYEFCKTGAMSTTATDICRAREAQSLLSKGFDLKKYVDRLPRDSTDVLRFNNAYRLMVNYESEVNSTAHSDEVRKAPLIVQFVGASGVGKSLLTRYVASLFASYLGFNCDNHETYHRSPGIEFWDGYSGQPIVLYDDIFQIKDPIACSAEAFEVIRCGNTVPLTLNMADINKKGVTKFVSPIILITSNEFRPENMGIACEEAFLRRRDLVIDVSIIPEVAGVRNINGKEVQYLDSQLVFRKFKRSTTKKVWSFEVLDSVTKAPREIEIKQGAGEPIRLKKFGWEALRQLLLESLATKNIRELNLKETIRRDLGIPKEKMKVYDHKKNQWTRTSNLFATGTTGEVIPPEEDSETDEEDPMKDRTVTVCVPCPKVSEALIKEREDELKALEESRKKEKFDKELERARLFQQAKDQAFQESLAKRPPKSNPSQPSQIRSSMDKLWQGFYNPNNPDPGRMDSGFGNGMPRPSGPHNYGDSGRFFKKGPRPPSRPPGPRGPPQPPIMKAQTDTNHDEARRVSWNRILGDESPDGPNECVQETIAGTISEIANRYQNADVESSVGTSISRRTPNSRYVTASDSSSESSDLFDHVARPVMNYLRTNSDPDIRHNLSDFDVPQTQEDVAEFQRTQRERLFNESIAGQPLPQTQEEIYQFQQRRNAFLGVPEESRLVYPSGNFIGPIRQDSVVQAGSITNEYHQRSMHYMDRVGGANSESTVSDLATFRNIEEIRREYRAGIRLNRARMRAASMRSWFTSLFSFCFPTLQESNHFSSNFWFSWFRGYFSMYLMSFFTGFSLSIMMTIFTLPMSIYSFTTGLAMALKLTGNYNRGHRVTEIGYACNYYLTYPIAWTAKKLTDIIDSTSITRRCANSFDGFIKRQCTKIHRWFPSIGNMIFGGYGRNPMVWNPETSQYERVPESWAQRMMEFVSAYEKTLTAITMVGTSYGLYLTIQQIMSPITEPKDVTTKEGHPLIKDLDEKKRLKSEASSIIIEDREPIIVDRGTMDETIWIDVIDTSDHKMRWVKKKKESEDDFLKRVGADKRVRCLDDGPIPDAAIPLLTTEAKFKDEVYDYRHLPAPGYDGRRQDWICTCADNAANNYRYSKTVRNVWRDFRKENPKRSKFLGWIRYYMMNHYKNFTPAQKEYFKKNHPFVNLDFMDYKGLFKPLEYEEDTIDHASWTTHSHVDHCRLAELAKRDNTPCDPKNFVKMHNDDRPLRIRPAYMGHEEGCLCANMKREAIGHLDKIKGKITIGCGCPTKTHLMTCFHTLNKDCILNKDLVIVDGPFACSCPMIYELGSEPMKMEATPDIKMKNQKNIWGGERNLRFKFGKKMVHDGDKSRKGGKLARRRELKRPRTARHECEERRNSFETKFVDSLENTLGRTLDDVSVKNPEPIIDDAAKNLYKKIVDLREKRDEDGRLETITLNEDACQQAHHILTAEGCPDPTLIRLLSESVHKNLGTISHNRNEAGSHACTNHFVAVQDRVIITVNHGLYGATTKSTIDIFRSTGGQHLNIPLADCDIANMSSLDLVAIRLPKNVPCFPTITHHFMTEESFAKYLDLYHLMLVVPRKSIDGPSHVHYPARAELKKNVVYLGPGNSTIEVARAISYSASTVAGDCGSVVFCANKKSPQKIIGMHIAGDTSCGMCTIITQECINDFIEELSDISIEKGRAMDKMLNLIDTGDLAKMPMLRSQCLIPTDGTNLIPYGRVRPKDGVHLQTKTRLVQTKIAGIYRPIIKIPAKLDIDEFGNDPLKIAVLCYGGETPHVDSATLERIFKYKLKLLDCSSYPVVGVGRRRLSVHECLNGSLVDEYITPLVKNTSAGWPYKNIKRSLPNGHEPGKLPFLIQDEDETFRMGPLLARRFTERLELAKEGIIPPTIWTVSLKDELRDPEDVKIGKTRTFVIPPVDLVIEGKCINGAFVACVERYHCDYHISVGINPHSMEWTQLIKRLMKWGTKTRFIGGDFGRFDRTIPAQYITGVGTFISAWYREDEEAARVRQVYMESVSASIQLVKRDLVRADHGNPSGAPMTTPLNCEVLHCLFIEAFGFLGEEYGYSYEDFHKFVEMATFGDDHLAAIDPVIEKFFNMRALRDFFAKYKGMKYNMTDKKKEMPLTMSLDEIDYLSRKFVWSEELNAYLAPLQQSSLNEMFNWRLDTTDETVAMESCARSMSIELFHYGRKYHDEEMEKIRIIFADNGLVFPADISYEKQLKQFYGYDGPNFIKDRADLLRLWIKEDPEEFNIPWEITTEYAEHVNILNRQYNQDILYGDDRYFVETKKIMRAQTLEVEDAEQDHTDDNDYLVLHDTDVERVTRTYDNTNVVPNPHTTPELYTQLARPRIIASGTWSPIDRFDDNTPILSVRPWLELSHNLPVFDLIKRFKYIRFDMRLRIRITGTRFHYGTAIAAWIPWKNLIENGSPDYLYHAQDLMWYKHLMMTPATNCMYELYIPFLHPENFVSIPTNLGDVGDSPFWDVGSLTIQAMAPLRSGEITNPVGIEISAGLENVVLAGLRKIPGEPRWTAQTRTQKDEGHEKSKTGVISGVADAVASVAGAVKSIPILTPAATMLETTSKTISLVAKGFGLCKPNDVQNPAVVFYAPKNCAYGVGLELANFASIYPENYIASPYDKIGGSEKDLEISSFISRPGLVSITELDGTVGIFSAIQSIFISPEHFSINGLDTPLKYMSRCFEFWRGSIQFDFRVVASLYHAARIAIHWIPNNEVAEYDDSNSSEWITQVVDIESTREFSITIPQLTNMSWLRTAFHSHAGTDAVRNHDNGELAITLYSRLMHPLSPIPPITLLMWARAGPDFEFAMPNVRLLQRNRLSDPRPTFAQGEMVADLNNSELFPNPSGFIDSNLYMTEKVTHLKHLMCRPTMCRWIDGFSQTVAALQYSPLDSIKTIKIPAAGNFFQFNFMTMIDYFRSVFRTSRGSFTTHAFIGTDIEELMFMSMEILPEGRPFFGSAIEENFAENVYGTVITKRGQGPNMSSDITIPWNCQQLFVFNKWEFNGFTTQFIRIPFSMMRKYLWNAAGADRVWFQTLYKVSAGDDFILGCLGAPPRLTSNFFVLDPYGQNNVQIVSDEVFNPTPAKSIDSWHQTEQWMADKDGSWHVMNEKATDRQSVHFEDEESYHDPELEDQN